MKEEFLAFKMFVVDNGGCKNFEQSQWSELQYIGITTYTVYLGNLNYDHGVKHYTFCLL